MCTNIFLCVVCEGTLALTLLSCCSYVVLDADELNVVFQTFQMLQRLTQ